MTGFPLSELQKWMHASLIAPRGTAAEAHARLASSNPDLPPDAGLAIYQRSYALRIAGCMQEQFPALHHALGDALFNDFVAEYTRALPPESYTLYDLGRRFAGFLDDTKPDALPTDQEPWFEFMVDLARFERQVFASIDCDGAETLQLATSDTPDDSLMAQPSLSVAHYRFPVAGYYHAVREGGSPGIPASDPIWVAVVREDFQSYTLNLSELHFLFLSAMCGGQNAQDALASVAQQTGHSLEQMQQGWQAAEAKRAEWIDAGLFLDARPQG